MEPASSTEKPPPLPPPRGVAPAATICTSAATCVGGSAGGGDSSSGGHGNGSGHGTGAAHVNDAAAEEAAFLRKAARSFREMGLVVIPGWLSAADGCNHRVGAAALAALRADCSNLLRRVGGSDALVESYGCVLEPRAHFGGNSDGGGGGSRHDEDAPRSREEYVALRSRLGLRSASSALIFSGRLQRLVRALLHGCDAALPRGEDDGGRCSGGGGGCGGGGGGGGGGAGGGGGGGGGGKGDGWHPGQSAVGGEGGAGAQCPAAVQPAPRRCCYLFNENFILKPPHHAGSAFRWHQDAEMIADAFTGEEAAEAAANDGTGGGGGGGGSGGAGAGAGNAYVSMWFALDDMSEENGCLVVPTAGGRVPPTALATVGRVPLCVPAGSVVALAHDSWHFSLPNRSATFRRAWMPQFSRRPAANPGVGMAVPCPH